MIKRFLTLKGAFDSHQTTHEILIDSVCRLEAGEGYATGGYTRIHFHAGGAPVWVDYNVENVKRLLDVVKSNNEQYVLRSDYDKVRDALIDAKEVIALCKPGHETRAEILHAAEELGGQIGYGALMNAGNVLWKRYLDQRGGAGGEFTLGPCQATVDRKLKELEEILGE